MGSRIGHFGRHPLCPECRYDLVATVADNRRVCPECGYEFEVHELIRESRPGDWTIWHGLGRLAIVLTVRTIFTSLLWALSVWGVFHTASALNLTLIPLLTLIVLFGIMDNGSRDRLRHVTKTH